MDEVLFRSSQRLETLQHQLGVVANESKQFIQEQGIHAKDQLVRLLNHSKLEQLKEGAKQLIVTILNLIEDLKKNVYVYFNPQMFIMFIFDKKWTKREVCFGCAGLLIGGIVGYCIGSAALKKTYPIRYMQAIQCTSYSGIEAATVIEDAVAPHECRSDEVLINVKAASVHTIDARICDGYGRRIRKLLTKYFRYLKHDLPVTLGRDCTGIITDVGQNVTRLEIGDEVWLTMPFWAPGTFSQTVLAPEWQVSRKPKTVGYEGGCSLPFAGGIALDVLRRANLDINTSTNKRILIQGGCTPVGCILVQVLHHWGAKVSCTCYKRAVPVAKALCVDDIIVLEESNVKNDSSEKTELSLLKELELREFFDVIIITKETGIKLRKFQKFCSQKGNVFSALPEKLQSDNFGFILGTIFSFYTRLKCAIQGIFGEQLNGFGETHICYRTLDEIGAMVERGMIQTVVDKVFHPNDIELALQHIQSSESIGSTIITFR